MPSWEGIEDSSSVAERIWMSRVHDEDPWKPLRKTDCRALNQSPDELVLIEGGRATADPINNIIRYNFYNSPSRQLCFATWFVKSAEDQKDALLLEPLSQADATLVETLYQSAIEATSSLGSGVQSVLDQEVMLIDRSDCRVVIVKSSAEVLSVKMKPKGWFGATHELQRGYQEYTVEGEEEEVLLGDDVHHLIFVVHGIGEALWSRQDVNITPGWIEEMNRARITMQKKQVSDWKKACEKVGKGEPLPPKPKRIELLPIEWWDKIHSSSSQLMKSLKGTTLNSIPALRAIANDVVFDVLMYLTPDFCETVLECVSTQIQDLYDGFQTVHPNFLARGGKCSIMGHSLGSVIVWDLLSILQENTKKNLSSVVDAKQPQQDGGGALTAIADTLCGGISLTDEHDAGVNVGYQAYASKTDEEDVHAVKNGAWGPSLPKKMTQSIPFVPHFTIFVGSPLGLFLTLRGAHAIFDEMLQKSINEAKQTAAGEQMNDTDDVPVPITSPFSLPSGSIYNIFHPSDPVAYRIEPLLMSQDTDPKDLPPPQYLVKKGQKLRLHVQAKQLGDGIRRSLAETTSTWSSLISSVTEQAVTALSAVDGEEHPSKKTKSKTKTVPHDGPLKFRLGGRSDRVDFQLQPGVIDNEYLSAVAAHSSYFTRADVTDFILDLTAEEEEVGAQELLLDGTKASSVAQVAAVTL